MLWTFRCGRCKTGSCRLGIPYYVMNFKNEFKKYVIDYFIDDTCMEGHRIHVLPVTVM